MLQCRDFTSNCFLRIAISDFCASSLASRVPRSCANDAPKYITKLSVSLSCVIASKQTFVIELSKHQVTIQNRIKNKMITGYICKAESFIFNNS